MLDEDVVWTLEISIHALARRATTTFALPSSTPSIFQSTPSHGERLIAPGYRGDPEGISIHALARRATQSTKSKMLQTGNFNPRPRTESDIDKFFQLLLILIHFNPRPRTESDSIVSPRSAGDTCYFNPRPRTESDEMLAYPKNLTVTISIHALARRATPRRGQI